MLLYAGVAANMIALAIQESARRMVIKGRCFNAQEFVAKKLRKFM